MAIKGIIFIILFAFCVGATIFMPHIGVYGYIADYCINPADQWYGRPFAQMGIRFSLLLAIATVIGAFFQSKKLYFGKSFFYRHEVYIIIFLLIVWMSYFIHPLAIDRYGLTDNPAIKLTKIIIFVFLLTHIVTSSKNIINLFWVLITVSFVLGIKAYNTPYGKFVSGRLEGLGGADFSDSNRFAGFMVGVLFLVGVQFLRSGTFSRIYSVISGAFIANALMLARSRGALLGLAVGMVMAVVTAPPKYRGKLMALILVAALSVLYLADDQVMDRLSTIDSSTEERDSSAQSRLDIWAGGVEMLFSNPLLGVGPGNFRTYIEIYQPEHPDRDAHNTIIRCGGELGFIGLGSFIIILFSTLKLLLGTMRDARNLDTKEGKDILWLSYGTLLGGTGMLVYGMTGTLLYTEYLWWFIAFPVSLRRALDRELELPENISVDRTA